MLRNDRWQNNLMSEPEALDGVAIRRGDPVSLYVNYFEVAHNLYEFLIELGQFRPSDQAGAGDISIHTRVAISPSYAKMLSELLSHAVTEHEAEHGPIRAIVESGSSFDIILRSLPDQFEERARELRSMPRRKNKRRATHPKKDR